MGHNVTKDQLNRVNRFKRFISSQESEAVTRNFKINLPPAVGNSTLSKSNKSIMTGSNESRENYLQDLSKKLDEVPSEGIRQYSTKSSKVE